MAGLLKLISYLPFLLKLIPVVLPYLPLLREVFDMLDDLWDRDKPLSMKDKLNIVIDAVQKALAGGYDFPNLDEGFWIEQLQKFQDKYLAPKA